MLQYKISENIDTEIDNIEIFSITNHDLSVIKDISKYHDYLLSKELVSAICNKPNEYKSLALSYRFYNSLTNTDVNDIRYRPIFIDSLNSCVIGFSDSNGVSPINIVPKKSRTTRQFILIKPGAKTDEQIILEAKQSMVSISFKTGTNFLNHRENNFIVSIDK
jgi:hypothetical protein